MPPFVLTVLNVVFLGVLYLFVYRTVRAVAGQLREKRPPAALAAPRKQRGRPRGPRSVVVVDERGSKSKPVPLDGDLRIGRSDACQLPIQDTYLSSFHARIFRRDGSWYVEDLGSTNGTYLNQRKVTAPAELRAGDRVKLGKTTLELRR